MPNVQLDIDCEGPLALNDNAFELCREFIKPQGDRFFQQVNRYDDYLVEVAKRPGYKSGDTLKLILPFLKAHGLTNAQIEAYSRKNVTLIARGGGGLQVPPQPRIFPSLRSAPATGHLPRPSG